jgi:hypothetical protein
MKDKLARWWPALIVVAAIAWQYRAPLLGRVWFFEDIEAYFVPLYTAAARAMRQGAFPTWELGAWSGQPLVGDPQLGLFYPPNWLWLLLRPVRFYAWMQLFHVAVGAGGMWAVARARGRSTAAAAVASLALALGAFCALELRHAMFVATTAWLPWLLWAIERWAQERTVDHVLWIAVTLALAILGGGWSMLVWGAVVVAIYAACAIARSSDRRLVTVGIAAASVLALALAAVQIVPAVAHARMSPRALGVTYEFAASYAWPSWRYALTLFLPTLYGDVARGTWHGGDDQWELCGYAIGLVGGLVALASLGLRDERRRERVALLVAVLLACDFARGAHGLLHPLLFHLPLFSSLRCPARALYIWTLAAPILAADGVDALGARRPSLRALVVAAVALELLVTWRGENPSTTLAAAETRPAAVGWLRAQHRPGRTTNDVHLGQSMHNMGLRWGVASAGGYHSLPIWRYLHLLWIANHGAPYPRAQLGDDLTAQGLWRFSSPIVDALDITYVLAPRARPIDAPGFVRVLAGDDGVDVWQNEHAFPTAFVVYSALYARDEPAAARAIADPAWQPGRYAVVEEPVDLPPSTVTPSPVARVDYALRGVMLTAGTHLVDWELVCPPLRTGAFISIVALLVAAALTTMDARRRRRQK